MEQEKIDKLIEIKKLYEAGVLTTEEMETEKAKVLNTPGSSKPLSPQHANNKKWFVVAGSVAVIIILAVLFATSGNDNRQKPSITSADVDVAEVNETDDEAAKSNSSTTLIPQHFDLTLFISS